MNAQQALSLINESIKNLRAYHLEPEEVPVKLNQNENPFDWPASVKDTILDYCRTRPWNRYPDFVPGTLKNALAEYTGLTPESVIVGNGSNEMLLVLLLSLANRARPVIINQPTFTVYRLLAAGLGCAERTVALTPDMRFDIGTLCRTARENEGAVMILCSPNSPTGSSLSEEEIRQVLEAHSGFLILDQAYVEFGGFNAVPLIDEYANLIVTRTFSKAMGGAGLRLGYLLGAPKVVAEINKIKLPYNINFFSDHVAVELLGHTEIVEERVAGIVRSRDDLTAFLRTLPFKAVYDSSANFVMVRVEGKDRLFGFLRDKGILVRDVSSYPMLDDCLRISVGSPDENAALKNALTEFFGG